ncbi:hypothetical protein [Pseudonocardia sp. GCM10023141]|uniref:hypothetical protein n=1 Tax=Pseudonocardia sp. GCM10023141 TaxID=3252653 RepID=UPI00360F96A8
MRAPRAVLAVLVAAAVGVSSGCAAFPAGRAAMTGSPQHITIKFVAGAPQGGLLRTRVPLGSRVELSMRSDVDENLVLHGYELDAMVPAGGTGTIAFTADVPGIFVTDAERSGVHVARIEVR